MVAPQVTTHACQRYAERFGVHESSAADRMRRLRRLWPSGETVTKGPGGFYRRRLVDGAVGVVQHSRIVTITGSPISAVMARLGLG